METLWQDLKYGIRMLAKSTGFTAVAVLTLALGIGANTAIFSLLDAALLRKLPVREPDGLVNFQVEFKDGFDPSFNYPLYTDYRDRNTVLDGLVAYDSVALTLTAGDHAERIRGMIVSGNFFDVLGVQPALGRGFLPEEGRTPDTHPVVVLGYGLWQRSFGGYPEVVGRSILVSGRKFTVVGVAPREFSGVMRGYVPDFYVPMMMLGAANPDEGSKPLQNRGYTWMQMLGRLKPGVSRAQAQDAMRALAGQIRESTPMNTSTDLVLSDGSRGFTGFVRDLSGPLQMMQLVVGLVLLIACANVANLLLTRALARRREVAIRLAIGAGRGRLVRQLLTESALLSIAGGAAGLLLVPWVVDSLMFFRPWATFALDVQLNARILGFSFLLMVASGFFFGIAPALQSLRTALVPALKEERGAGGAGGRGRLRGALVVVQLALSVAVLVTAGLCLRSLRGLQAIDAGFDPNRVLAMSLDPGLSGYDPARGLVLYSELLQRMAALPGVESAAFAEMLPLSGGGMRITSQPEGHVSTQENPINLTYNVVSPGWFRTMGVPVVRGRDFTAADNASGQPVAIVNEALVAKYWPGQNGVGKHIEFSAPGPGEPRKAALQVVGVVRDSKYRSLTEPVPPTMFCPLAQEYASSVVLFLRGAAPRSLAGPVRQAVQQVDSNLPVFNIRTLAEQKDTSLYTSRMAATLLSALGVLGLALAALGVYGVMAFTVEQRTREIGIRMALGAQRFDVLRLVVSQGARFVLIGLALGLGGALAMGRVVRSLLYGVEPTDPLTFISVALLLCGVALLACYLPARRASRVDPIVALRYE